MLNKGNADEEKRAAAATKEVFQTALDLNGTISGEHGIGLSKQPYIGMELSEKEIELMRGIKKVFDPENIMNPGKIFPQE
jgi:glycolate oxidase